MKPATPLPWTPARISALRGQLEHWRNQRMKFRSPNHHIQQAMEALESFEKAANLHGRLVEFARKIACADRGCKCTPTSGCWQSSTQAEARALLAEVEESRREGA